MMTESMAKPRAKGTSRASKPRTSRANGDSRAVSKIRFSATLFRPVATAKAVDWTFLTLPKEASAKLPSRGMISVEGAFNGLAFQATLEPDGQGGHWLKVDRKLRERAGAEAGDVVSLEIAPVAEEPEPSVPADLRKALAAAPSKARDVWSDITPVARRDWIQWIESAKRAQTRLKRVESACDMLAKGKRRACCFDRSGMYSKSLSCPVADDTSSAKSTKVAKKAAAKRVVAKPALLAGGNPQIAKGDGDAPVQAYIAAMPGWKHDIGRRLDELIVRTVPGVRKAVKWNTPFYGVEDQGWFLGFHCLAKYVKVAFFRGTSLRPMPPGESTQKEVRYLNIHENDELDEARFAAWVKQASQLPGQRM